MCFLNNVFIKCFCEVYCKKAQIYKVVLTVNVKDSNLKDFIDLMSNISMLNIHHFKAFTVNDFIIIPTNPLLCLGAGADAEHLLILISAIGDLRSGFLNIPF